MLAGAVRTAILGIGFLLAGCAKPPPTHLDLVRGSADSLELGRACLLDISEAIEGLKPANPELSGWRPLRPGVRALTYDYKGCRIWVDLRRDAEKPPPAGDGPWALRSLPALGLKVYCAVDGRAELKKALEDIIHAHVGKLAELDAGRAKEQARAKAQAKGKGK
jgi:hypothetical protein